MPAGSQDIDYSRRFMDRLTEFMKVQKYCRDGDTASCMGGAYDDMDTAVAVILNNGASLFFLWGGDELALCLVGCKKSNWGDEHFSFVYGDNVGIELPDIPSRCNHYGYPSDWGKWVMDYGNMDYLNVNNSCQCKNDTSKVLGYGEGKVQSCK